MLKTIRKFIGVLLLSFLLGGFGHFDGFINPTVSGLWAKETKKSSKKKKVIKIKKYSAEEEARYLEIFKKAFYTLRRGYVDESKVDAEKLTKAAIEGMLQSLDDPFSTFLSGQKRKQFIDSINNTFVGIGVYIQPHEEGIEILGVIKSGPAWEVGLKVKDVIVEAGDVKLKGLSLDESRGYIMGAANSVVKLKIKRGVEKKLLTVNVERRSVNSKTVFTKTIVGAKVKVGYIKINIFGSTTAQEFETALGFLKKELLQGERELKRGLVIDLRDNPGGLLDVVVGMVNRFVNEGRIVSTKGRDKKEEVFKANRSVEFPKFYPLIVLINEHSASASEIMSGSLKDHERALLLGRNSYGKFSVQRIFDLEPNKYSLKMTVAGYYLPKGEAYHKVGITPQVVVTNTRPRTIRQEFYESGDTWNEEDALVSKDPVLREALHIFGSGSYKVLLRKANGTQGK